MNFEFEWKEQRDLRIIDVYIKEYTTHISYQDGKNCVVSFVSVTVYLILRSRTLIKGVITVGTKSPG